MRPLLRRPAACGYPLLATTGQITDDLMDYRDPIRRMLCGIEGSMDANDVANHKTAPDSISCPFQSRPVRFGSDARGRTNQAAWSGHIAPDQTE